MDQKIMLEDFQVSEENYEIKQELDDAEFNLADLHHSIDIKEESHVPEFELKEEFDAQECQQLECYACGIKFYTKLLLKKHLKTQCIEKPVDFEYIDLKCPTKHKWNEYVECSAADFDLKKIMKHEENHQTNSIEDKLERDVYDDDEDDTDKKLKNKTGRNKTLCKYCQNDVTNFERHLERNHVDEKEVLQLIQLKKNTKEELFERRKILCLIRNEANFDKFVHDDNQHYTELLPCSHCKRLLSRTYLHRHFKNCIAKPINDTGKNYKHITESQTLLACASNRSDAITKLRVKDEVFSIMAGDQISMVVKTDFLIMQFGESYLKKLKKGQIITRCSNKMREFARLLMEVRKRVGDDGFTFVDVLNPTIFDVVLAGAKTLGGYDEVKNKFKSPSTAMHLGTSLKQICDIFARLLMEKHVELKKFDVESKLMDLERFRFLVESQWVTKVSSLALRNLAEKSWNKGHLECNRYRIGREKKSSNRVRWTTKQKQVVENYFQRHIKRKISPKKKECLELKGKHLTLLENLDWVKIKTFVYNTYKNL